MTWSQDAYVGQKVVCINFPLGFPWGPKLNEIYTISYIGMPGLDATNNLNKLGVSLLEIPSPYRPNWLICHFSPVQSTKTGMAILKEILVTQKVKEDA